MLLWTALLLGLAGSFHCAGMCGPLTLALPVSNGSSFHALLRRGAYHSGRIFIYGLLGAVAGLLGETVSLAGVQRWLSIGAGAAVLLGAWMPGQLTARWPVHKLLVTLKSHLAQRLRQRSLTARFTFGALNGLLPCGLVYVAMAAAAATAHFASAVAFMLSFGAGTIPMLLAVNMAGQKAARIAPPKLRRLLPACTMIVAVALILRGMSLGIPYLSPDLSGGHSPPCCL